MRPSPQLSWSWFHARYFFIGCLSSANECWNMMSTSTARENHRTLPGRYCTAEWQYSWLFLYPRELRHSSRSLWCPHLLRRCPFESFWSYLLEKCLQLKEAFSNQHLYGSCLTSQLSRASVAAAIISLKRGEAPSLSLKEMQASSLNLR